MPDRMAEEEAPKAPVQDVIQATLILLLRKLVEKQNKDTIATNPLACTTATRDVAQSVQKENQAWIALTIEELKGIWEEEGYPGDFEKLIYAAITVGIASDVEVPFCF